MGAGDGNGQVSKGEGWELRLGKWQDVMADVECDALICDPPYGSRTHEGNSGRIEQMGRASLDYGHFTPDDVAEFVGSLASRCSGWILCMTSDDLIPAYRAAYRAAGRYDFAPVPVLQHRPRLSGDGPGSCAVYAVVSRPRERRFMSWGSLPGWYEAPLAGDGVQGGKPLGLMRAIIRDYTRPGDLVCDPCAGGGTTLLAARMEGRRSIGAEMMPEHYDIARRRLAHLPQGTDRQPSLFGDDR